MKIIRLGWALALLMLVQIEANAQAQISPAIEWVRQPRAKIGIAAAAVSTVDSGGNVFVIGEYTNTSIGFGPGGPVLTNSSGGKSSYIAKLSSTGETVWMKQAVGSGVPADATVGPDGAILVTGIIYVPTIEIGNTVLTNQGQSDLFVAKFDATGAPLWARSFGDKLRETPQSIAADRNGNVYICGSIESTTVSFGSIRLSNTNAPDMFLAKLNPQGTLIWATSAGSPLNGESANAASVKTDLDGNVYVGGYFQDRIRLGKFEKKATSTYNMFVAKFNSFGDVLWLQTNSGLGDSNKTAMITEAISVEENGYSYLAGRVDGTNQLGSFLLRSNGSSDGFAAKLDPYGMVLWARVFGGSEADNALAISSDNSGSVYVAGLFSGTLTRPLPEAFSRGASDAWFLKLDTFGNFQWFKNFGGEDSDFIDSVILDHQGGGYFSGKFHSGYLHIDEHELVNGTDNPVFVTKFNQPDFAQQPQLRIGNQADGLSLSIPNLVAKGQRLQSSSNLVDWVDEAVTPFPYTRAEVPLGSSLNSGRKFYRLTQ